MAKNQGIVRLRGSIDGVTYTEGVNGRISRSKSSLDKTKMDSNPKFNVLRLYQKELRTFSKYGALLRIGITSELKQVKASRGTQRLNKILYRIKEEDKTNRMGERQVSEGLQTAKGKSMLKSFDFYGKTNVSALLGKRFDLDMASGIFRIPEFNPAYDVFAPKNVSHVQFRALIIGLDAATLEVSVKRSSVVNLALEDTLTDLLLDTDGMPDVTTQLFYVVQVLFFRELNGFQDLAATDSAALTIMEIG